jgi:hypothetical protein
VIYSSDKNKKDALFLNFILVKNSTCFEQTYCLSSGVLILDCRTSYVDCLLAVRIHNCMTNTNCCEYSIKTPDDGQYVCPKQVKFFTKIKLRNSASNWLLL